MPHRSVSLLLVLLVAALPALCASGVLEHECPCDQQRCEHESGCPDDPCHELVRSGTGSTVLVSELFRLQALAPCLAVGVAPAAPVHGPTSARVAPAAPRPALVERPLRI